MAFSTHGAQLAYDPVTRRGVAGTPVKVLDVLTGERVDTFSLEEQPMALITGVNGYFPDFKVAGSVPLVTITIGSITMASWSFEAALAMSEAAGEAAAAANAAAISAWEAANLVGAPADAAVAAVVSAIGSLTRTALDGLYGSLATIVKAGLMPAEDKELLDRATPAATSGALALRDASGQVLVGTPTSGAAATTKAYVDAAGSGVVRSSSAPLGMVSYHWAGTPHASASIKRIDGVEVARNTATNPSFESSFTGQSGVNSSIGGGTTVVHDSAWFASGTKSIKNIPATGGTATNTAAYPWGGSTTSFGRMGVVPGKTYTVAATLRLATAQAGSVHATTRRCITAGNAANLGLFRSESSPNVAGEFRHVCVFTVPEGTTDWAIRLLNGSSVTPAWWDNITLEEGITDGTYFDGDTLWRAPLWLDSAGALWAWTGSAWAKAADVWDAGWAKTVHTHPRIQQGAHMLDLTTNGWLDHKVGDTVVWEVSPGGVLEVGTVPRARLSAPITLSAGSNLDEMKSPNHYHANNAAASASTGFPVPYAGLLEVEASEGGGMVYQRYTVYATASASTKGKIYSRSFYSGTWSAWETPLIGKGIYGVRVAITPSAANTPTALNVTYPVGHFTSSPMVTVSAYTSVPGTTVLGVSADSETASGCTVYASRTNTSGTGINVIAIGI